MARPWGGQPPGCSMRAMLAARCCDRCPPTGADGVAAPAIGVALASSNTVTLATAVAAAIAPSIPAGSGPSAASSTTSAATTSTAATTFG